jgi:YVTN family beta-propeller protein
LYVVNTGSESLSVIDHQEVIDTIELGAQPHGQAPASSGDRLYVTTEGGVGEIIAIDPTDHSIAWRKEVGADLNEPHLTRDDRFLYAPDLLAARVIVMDVESAEVADTVEMVDARDGSSLFALHNTYGSHDGRSMYVTAILSRKIAQIDTASRQIVRIYDLSGEPRPAALTADDATMYVQLSDLHGFVALDLESGAETRIEWPEPSEIPPEVAEGTLPTKCHGIGLTPDGRELWAASNLERAVHVYSVPDLRQLEVVEVGKLPNWIAFSRNGTTAFVTNTDPLAESGSVSVIDVATRRVITTLAVGNAPKRIHRLDITQD